MILGRRHVPVSAKEEKLINLKTEMWATPKI
jgi:hypothetical protein